MSCSNNKKKWTARSSQAHNETLTICVCVDLDLKALMEVFQAQRLAGLIESWRGLEYDNNDQTNISSDGSKKRTKALSDVELVAAFILASLALTKKGHRWY